MEAPPVHTPPSHSRGISQTRTGSASPTGFRPFRDCPLFLEQRPSSFAHLDPVGSGLCPLAVPTLPPLPKCPGLAGDSLEACPFHISICCPLVSWDRDVPHETAPWASTRPDAYREKHGMGNFPDGPVATIPCFHCWGPKFSLQLGNQNTASHTA